MLTRAAKYKRDSLLILPIEVLERIIEYLPLKDKLSLRLTCKTLDAEVIRKVEFHPVLTDETTDSILNIREEIKHKLAGFRCADLAKSDIFPNGVPEFAPQITKLSMIDLQYNGESISSNNLYSMFHMFPNVTQLELAGKILNEGIGIKPQEFRGIKLDHLLALKLSFTGWRAKFCGLRAIELAKFPKLEKLDIFVHEDHLRLNFGDYDSLCFLIGSHASTLKHLKLKDEAFAEWPAGTHNIPSVRMPETLLLLGEVQLETLELLNPLFQAYSEEKLAYFQLLIAQQSTLKVVSVDFPEEFPSFRQQFLEAVEKSSNTLESITYKHYPLDQIFQVNMSYFPCPNLKRLSITTLVQVFNLHLIPNSIEYLLWDSPISTNEVTVFRHLPNLIEIEFGPLAGYQSHEIFEGIFENPKTKRIIGCTQESRGLPFVINRDFIRFQSTIETYLSF